MYFDLPFCVKSVKRVKSVKLNFGNLFSVGNPFPDASKCKVYMLGTRLCVKIKIEREKERKRERE